MDHSLKVTIQNICLFVLGADDAEGWFIDDEKRHKPVLVLDKKTMALPNILAGKTELDLTGSIVSFGTGDPANGGRDLPPGRTDLAGTEINRLADIGKISPGAKLTGGWTRGRNPPHPEKMATRLMLSGGKIEPWIQQCGKHAEGESKHWIIGRHSSQPLTSQSYFHRGTDDVPFVRITYADRTIDIPLKGKDGKYVVSLGSKDRTHKSQLRKQDGITFIDEFLALYTPFSLVDGQRPVPLTYWPDYPPTETGSIAGFLPTTALPWTDPDGGPCPQGVFGEPG